MTAEVNAPQPSELDARIAALTHEYEATIASLARRAGTLAAELAAAQMKIAAQAKLLADKEPKE